MDNQGVGGLEKERRWRSEACWGYLAFGPGGGPAPGRWSASAGPCEEEQFPCHLGAFIFISKRKQNAELGIWQVFLHCLLEWGSPTSFIRSPSLLKCGYLFSTLYLHDLDWKRLLFFLFHHSDSTQRSSWGAVILPGSLGRKKQLTCIFSCYLLNHKAIISKAEGWCLVWNRCFDGDVCEFFTFCSKQEDWI